MISSMEHSQCLDEYEKLVMRMSSPRVVIDNAVCSTATVVKVDSARKHGILLDAVQILIDLNLSIKKAYISCDGRWFMDVFHLTDEDGNKLTDESVMRYIEESLGSVHYVRSSDFKGMTTLELTGTDRLGLLSEVFGVLSELQCSIVESNVWTHNGRIAALLHIKDSHSGSSIEDSEKLDTIQRRLRNVLKGVNNIESVKISVFTAPITHTERRLHQLMYADRDYDHKPIIQTGDDTPVVTVQHWAERAYSVVNIQCKDRAKLMFDVICTLTDMQYIVFHATINTAKDRAYMEFYIRHTDGTPITLEAESQRVGLCLQAAIERRSIEGVRLELCTSNRDGLLADVTRTFRENELNVTRAEISTSMDTAQNKFYVTDTLGNCADPKIIDLVRESIGVNKLYVKEPSLLRDEKEERGSATCGIGAAVWLSLGSLLMKNLYNLGLIGSYF